MCWEGPVVGEGRGGREYIIFFFFSSCACTLRARVDSSFKIHYLLQKWSNASFKMFYTCRPNGTSYLREVGKKLDLARNYKLLPLLFLFLKEVLLADVSIGIFLMKHKDCRIF